MRLWHHWKKPVVAATLVSLLLGSTVARAEVLEITGEFPAANREASFLRTISVDRFQGPDGPTLAVAIERALSNSPLHVVDGRAGDDRPEGSVVGGVSTDIDVRPFTKEERRCVEKNDAGQCLREDQVAIPCSRRSIDINADIRIVRTTDGKIVYSVTRPIHDETTWCERGGPDRTVDSVAADAMREIADYVRGQVAPHVDTYTVRVRENVNGFEKDYARRFKDLVNQTKRDPQGACAGWNALQTEVPGHPSILFNLGVCAEQRGDFEGAVKLYTDAARAGANEGREGAERATRLIQGRDDALERARQRV